jgi:hypothetical protein
MDVAVPGLLYLLGSECSGADILMMERVPMLCAQVQLMLPENEVQRRCMLRNLPATNACYPCTSTTALPARIASDIAAVSTAAVATTVATSIVPSTIVATIPIAPTIAAAVASPRIPLPPAVVPPTVATTCISASISSAAVSAIAATLVALARFGNEVCI